MGGFQGTGSVSLKTLERSGASGVSALGQLFLYPADGINSIRLQVSNAGFNNEVALWGSVNGSDWTLIGTVRGNQTELYSTQAYAFVKAETITYGGTPFDIAWKSESAISEVVSSLVDENGDPYSPTNPVPVTGNISVTVGGISQPNIINTPAPTLGEYTIVVPSSAKNFTIKMRNSMGMKIGWSSGSTVSNFVTMQPGTVYSRENLILSAPLNVYVSPRTAGSVIELEFWS